MPAKASPRKYVLFYLFTSLIFLLLVSTKNNILRNVISTNKMWGEMKTVLHKEINFKLGSEEIYAGEEEVKNIAGRTHMKEGSKVTRSVAHLRD